MVKRYSGGFISSQTLNVSRTTASGLFDLPYQIKAQKNSLWPNQSLGPPQAYLDLINNFTSTVYYISPTGSDSNSGTSTDTPLQTYAQFRTLTSSITTSIMCVFLPGTYTLSSIIANATYSECCFTDENYERIFVCQVPNQTIFEWTANAGKRDAQPFYFRNANTRFYGGVIKRNNNGRTLNYATSFFNNSTMNFVAKVYNVVIAEVNANNYWSLSYSNSTWPSTMGVYYCTFAVGAAALGSYSGGTSFIGDYCAGNYSYTGTFPSFTNYVNANGGMNATTYAISGTSGVYNGTYAWPIPQ